MVKDVYTVKKVVEKTEKPPTRLAIMLVYAFNALIFKALDATSPGKGGEVELTDGIQRVIDWVLKVLAVKLQPDMIRLDIGNSEEITILQLAQKIRKLTGSAPYLFTHSFKDDREGGVLTSIKQRGLGMETENQLGE